MREKQMRREGRVAACSCQLHSEESEGCVVVCQKKVTFQDGWVSAVLGEMSVPFTGSSQSGTLGFYYKKTQRLRGQESPTVHTALKPGRAVK